MLATHDAISARTFAGCITRENIKSVLDDVAAAQRTSGTPWPESLRQEQAAKLATIPLRPNSKALVLGPGGTDLLPLVLHRLGVQPTIVETWREQWDTLREVCSRSDKIDQRNFHESLSDVSRSNEKFDYVFAFAVLHNLVPLQTQLLSHAEGRSVAHFWRSALCSCFWHLSELIAPQGAWLLLNGPGCNELDFSRNDNFQFALTFFRRLHGAEVEVSAQVDIVDLSLSPAYFNEIRAGLAIRCVARSEANSRPDALSILQADSVAAAMLSSKEVEINFAAPFLEADILLELISRRLSALTKTSWHRRRAQQSGAFGTLEDGNGRTLDISATINPGRLITIRLNGAESNRKVMQSLVENLNRRPRQTA